MNDTKTAVTLLNQQCLLFQYYYFNGQDFSDGGCCVVAGTSERNVERMHIPVFVNRAFSVILCHRAFLTVLRNGTSQAGAHHRATPVQIIPCFPIYSHSGSKIMAP